MQSTRFCFKKG